MTDAPDDAVASARTAFRTAVERRRCDDRVLWKPGLRNVKRPVPEPGSATGTIVRGSRAPAAPVRGDERAIVFGAINE